MRRRALDIADHAHNSRGGMGERTDFLRGLDETERQRMCLYRQIWRCKS